jgi:beta-glucosidase
VKLGYEIGCTNHKLLPRLEPKLVKPDGHDQGFKLEYYNNLELEGAPVYSEIVGGSEQMMMGEAAPGVDMTAFSARMTTSFTPEESGTHHFSLMSVGEVRLFVDDASLIDNWTTQTRGEGYFGFGTTEVQAGIEMNAGQTYQLRLEYNNQDVPLFAVFRLGYLQPVELNAIERAANLAAQSDIALVFVGTNGDWESEGHDRADLELPGEQAALIERVAAANPNTVVVLQTGSPVIMPWLEKVAGVIQAWFPGQECGHAIADVLFGAVNPSGKLTQTYPMRLQDNPTFINYPGENGHVRYGEGIFVGYRYYDKKEIAPLFPFGFGLSYTSFGYSNLRLSTDSLEPNQSLTVSVDVTNTGKYEGREIVQLYVHDVECSVSRPLKELKGFAKVMLEPGETKTVTLNLEREALAYWDDAQHAWVAEAGEFEVLIGSSSQEIHARGAFRLTKTVSFGGPSKTV